MSSPEVPAEEDAEIAAIGTVVNALRPLPKDARQRVLRYVSNKFGMSSVLSDFPPLSTESALRIAPEAGLLTSALASADGVSPSAQKWMQRSGISREALGEIFSIGADQIDLVTTKVPGGSKRARMRNVLLLLGIAAYLSTGTPRLAYEHLREACQHYNALDSANFAAHLKGFSADVSGSKDSGLTLTARGLAAATTLIKGMTKAES
jgi:hypothetical protein